MTVLKWVWSFLSPFLGWCDRPLLSLKIFEPLPVMIWQFSSESGDFWAPTCDDMIVLKWVPVYEPYLWWCDSHWMSLSLWALPVMMWQSSNESEFLSTYLWWCDSPQTSQHLECPAVGKDSWNLPPLWRLVVAEPSRSPPHLLQP